MQIIRYNKYITTAITRELTLPEDAQSHQPIGTELATVDGCTYVFLPDGSVLPEGQPAEIASSIVNLDPALLTDLLRESIKAASAHVRLINATVAQKIADQYSLADEIKLIRTAPSAEFEAYNAHAEACRAWGREQKAAIGL